MTTISLADQLTTLGLRATAIGLDDLVARATKHRWSPTQLLEPLAAAEQEDPARGLDRRLSHYGTRTSLLIVDEIGYLSYDTRNADLLFQVIARRHEKKSLILTTNLAFSDWPTIFPNAGSAIALIDRIVHHADIIALEGDSYRRRVAEQTLTRRRATKG